MRRDDQVRTGRREGGLIDENPVSPGLIGMDVPFHFRGRVRSPPDPDLRHGLLSTGTVPVIELHDVVGAKCAMSSERGGHVPVLKQDGATSLPNVYAAGDCAGIGGDAAEGGKAAAAAVLASLGKQDEAADRRSAPGPRHGSTRSTISCIGRERCSPQAAPDVLACSLRRPNSRRSGARRPC